MAQWSWADKGSEGSARAPGRAAAAHCTPGVVSNPLGPPSATRMLLNGG